LHNNLTVYYSNLSKIASLEDKQKEVIYYDFIVRSTGFGLNIMLKEPLKACPPK
jgi:hypothetical protein